MGELPNKVPEDWPGQRAAECQYTEDMKAAAMDLGLLTAKYLLRTGDYELHQKIYGEEIDGREARGYLEDMIHYPEPPKGLTVTVVNTKGV